MTNTKLDRKMVAVLQQADLLRHQVEVGDAEIPPQILPDTLDALSETLEELHVAQEELIQSNAELEDTRNQLEAEKYRYQDLFEFAPDGYLVTNPQGVILEANEAAAALLGHQPQGLIGKPVSVYVHNDEKAAYRIKLNHVSEGDWGSDWELTLVSKDRQSFPVSVNIAVIRDPTEAVVGLRWMLRDITDQVRMKKTLQKSHDELEERVEERTHYLRVAINSMTGRELRMIELKEAIKKLRAQIRNAGMTPVANDPLIDGLEGYEDDY